MTVENRDVIEARGTVVRQLPNDMYRVELEGSAGARGGDMIVCHVSGETRMHLPRVTPGDTVTVRLMPYDSTRGRITGRI